MHGFVEIETLDEWPNVKVRVVPLDLVEGFILTGTALRAGVGGAGNGEARGEGGDAGPIDRRPGDSDIVMSLARASRIVSPDAGKDDLRVEGDAIVIRT